MNLSKKFEQSLLKSEANVVGKQLSRRNANQYMGSRLRFINTLCDAGLDRITSDNDANIFRTSKEVNALGLSISIAHSSGSEIQFSYPRDDRKKLLLSVLPPYSPNGSGDLGKIYDYTGHIDAANERLVEWLAEVAPEYSAKVGAIIDKIETPPREQVIIMDRG